MKRFLDYLWPLLGLIAVVVSIWLLSKEFKGEAVASQVWLQLESIKPGHYLLSVLSALLAYAALAWYDRIALTHLDPQHPAVLRRDLFLHDLRAVAHDRRIRLFGGHGALPRLFDEGLTASQVAILVAITSITFALGALLIGGIVLVFEPQELRRVAGMLPEFLTNITIARLIGIGLVALVALYIAGSILRLPPLVVGRFRIDYPGPAIAARQFVAAPLEIIGAAGIIYFALPKEGNPGFFVVLAIFLGSFSAALVSNAPAGAGVFDLLFINALPTIPKAKVLAAVLMFRLFYLLIPLAFAIVIMVLFERRRLGQALRPEPATHALPMPPQARRRRRARAFVAADMIAVAGQA